MNKTDALKEIESEEKYIDVIKPNLAECDMAVKSTCSEIKKDKTLESEIGFEFSKKNKGLNSKWKIIKNLLVIGLSWTFLFTVSGFNLKFMLATLLKMLQF